MLSPAVVLLPLFASWAAGQDYGEIDIAPAGLMPRYFIGAPIIAMRDGPPCAADSHRCIDIEQPDFCCPNHQYCYINPDGAPRCCEIGGECDSACRATAYQCPTVVTTAGTTTTSAACCGRNCKDTSYFQCEQEFGGGCCHYGATCASGGSCRLTRTTSSASLTLTPIDSQCTATSQHACDDGGGCCDNWNHCTLVNGSPACALGNPSMTSIAFVPANQGLSTGAKAGIGAGVAILACIIVGVITWMCVAKRRKRQRTNSQRSGGQEVMSEVTTDSRPRPLRGIVQDYFGPDAVSGPFTETATSAATSPGRNRGVPVHAQSPNDIAAPVEIDSRMMKPDFIDLSPIAPSSPAQHTSLQATPETTDGRFELYGTDMPSPSPQFLTPGSIRSATVSDRSPGP